MCKLVGFVARRWWHYLIVSTSGWSETGNNSSVMLHQDAAKHIRIVWNPIVGSLSGIVTQFFSMGKSTLNQNWYLYSYSFKFGLLRKFISHPKGWITWKCTLKTIKIQLSKPYYNIIIHQKNMVYTHKRKKLYCTFIESNKYIHT